jgi:hypothetical protein
LVISQTHRDIEWEFLQEPLIITQIIDNPKLPKSIKEIEVWRDDEYQIKAMTRTHSISTLDFNNEINKESIIQNTNELINDVYMPGSFFERFEIKGLINNRNDDAELSECYIKFYPRFDDELIVGYISAHELLIKKRKKMEVEGITDWYLNGSTIDLFFPRKTVRKVSKIDMNLERRRYLEVNFPGDFNFNNTLQKIDNRRDFAYINTDGVKFFVAEVPKEFGPSWSKNICIEYHKYLGQIPDSEQRSAISEIV